MTNPGAMLVGAIAAVAGAATFLAAVRGVRTGGVPLFAKDGTYAGEARGWRGRVVAVLYFVFALLLLAVGLGILAGRLAL